MSFICSFCHFAAPRNFSPIIEVKTRHRPDGVGEEIAEELSKCPTCVGIELPKAVVPDYSTSKLFAQGFARAHVKKCDGTTKVRKRGKADQIEPCRTCTSSMGTFAAMGPQELAVVLEDTLAPRNKFNFASVALEALHRQTESTNKGSHADFAASYKVLKAYEQRGGGI